MAREMKDSGVAWIGKIPVGWNVRKIKHVANFFNGDRGKNYPSGADLVDDGVIFLTSNNIRGIQLDCSPDISKFITEERYSLLGGAKIQKGDIIYCLRGSVGNCAINKSVEKGTVASSLVDIRPTDVNSDFLNFYLQSPANSIQTSAYMNGTCAANLSAENVANYYFVQPPIPEQNVIANFLNSKCAEIDAVLEKTRTSIEEYKKLKQAIITQAVTKGVWGNRPMKESGIEWASMIPSEWESVNPKALFSQRKEKAAPGERQLTSSQKYGIVYQDDYMELTGSRVVVVQKDFDILKHVEAGDFIISMRSFQGGLEYSTKTGSISSAYVMLVPNLNLVYPRFYRWLLKSEVYVRALQRTSNMVRDGQAMRYSNFAQVRLYTVPLQEQIEIADYLDEKCAELDALIEKKEKFVSEIESYKKSLIYEYVTGKKEVI